MFKTIQSKTKNTRGGNDDDSLIKDFCNEMYDEFKA